MESGLSFRILNGKSGLQSLNPPESQKCLLSSSNDKGYSHLLGLCSGLSSIQNFLYVGGRGILLVCLLKLPLIFLMVCLVRSQLISFNVRQDILMELSFIQLSLFSFTSCLCLFPRLSNFQCHVLHRLMET